MEDGTDTHSDELFEQLWTDYLEGDLDEAGIEQLRQLLTGNEKRLQQVRGLYQSHRLLGFLVNDSEGANEAFVQETLSRLPKDGDAFTSEVMRRQRELAQSTAGTASNKNQLVSAALWIVTACVAVVLSGWLWSRFSGTGSGNDSSLLTQATSTGVKIARLAHAKFFGELTPQIQSAVPFGKEYTLISGMVELHFPDGATAIIEGPAVFRVRETDLLAMDMGTCSVHAPPGAEGFRIETPASTIVDRGTRFSVKVDETSETEVQVVEGMADVYPVIHQPNVGTAKREISLAQEVRLTEKQALRVQDIQAPRTAPASFDGADYRKGLPDRIISYAATRAADGHAETLTHVTVQRDGEEMVYPVDQLIGAELTWFQATKNHVADYLFAPADKPVDARTLLSDPSLIKGVINPGGSRDPLKADPVMKRDLQAGVQGTPGMGIRFRTPVRNGPGPDIVFIELNSVIYPPEGDAFHVSPLNFKPGLKSHTIHRYDLNLYSPEALQVTRPYVHFSKTELALSLDELRSMKMLTRPTQLVYRAVAVGIDLSDLGYQPGEMVEGLFIQDTTEDKHHVDPVFIGGLP